MLELTRWLADYYACSWGQALDAAVPAGVKKHAGTRVGTFLVVPEETREALRTRTIEPRLSAKQAAVLDVLCRGRRAAHDGRRLPAGQVQPRARPGAPEAWGWCTRSAVGCRWACRRTAGRRRASGRGLDRPAPPPARDGGSARAGPDRRAVGDPGADRAGARVGRLRAVPDPRGDRQRQDRGLSFGDRAGRGAGEGGDRAGPRDQPDAADDPTVPPTVRPGRRPPQPPERRRAASALAEHRLRRDPGRRRSPVGRLRAGAEAGADRHRRGAREHIQAGDGAEVSRSRRGGQAGQMEGIPILLGSATPSLESWRNAERGRYTRLSMPSASAAGRCPRSRSSTSATRRRPWAA